jgi:hypothetical protein
MIAQQIMIGQLDVLNLCWNNPRTGQMQKTPVKPWNERSKRYKINYFAGLKQLYKDATDGGQQQHEREMEPLQSGNSEITEPQPQG